MSTIRGLDRAAALALALSMAVVGGASAGIVRPTFAVEKAMPGLTTVQYGYGYYRPYPRYGFYARRRYYNNHFGPGAAKERYRTNLTFCRSQPSRC